MSLFRFLGRRGLFAVAIAAFIFSDGPAPAQGVSKELLRGNDKIVKLFREVVAEPSESTVRVQCNGKDVALGTVVGADGLILTKASELTGKIECRFKDGTTYIATTIGVHEPYDLALLKIDASKLKPIQWEDSKAARVGRWVASVAPADDPVAIGVISVATRGLKPGDQPPKILATNSGFLGVGLDDAEGGAKIIDITGGSPAEKIGLKLNDIVISVNDKKVLGRESMINIILKYKPGDEVTLGVRRADKELTFKAKLAKRPSGVNPQELMGSALSNRRGGFPSILQHDTVIKPVDCGGPLVDLDGKVVGINIARAGRTESYAVPSEAVRELLPQLISGELAPPPPNDPDAPKPPKREPGGK
jgi:serine protease Do